ncbi:MAG: DUF420 domain-containing protein [archaeon]
MALANAKRRAKERPGALTVVLTVVGYALVLGTLFVGLPIYPEISRATVNVLSHAIAGVNTTATVLLVLGWWWIRKGEVDKHRAAMGSAFVLILVFLVLYLLKTGGGGTKEIDLAMGPVKTAYLAMLAIHVLLSILAVPVVLYALILGLTHTPTELRNETPHRRIGRIAAGSWILSLVLGVVTYLMLNHVYGYEFAAA